MKTEERNKILEGAKEAFFLAMLDGYAGGENRLSTKITSNNGYTKTVTFVHGDYIVKDEWHTNPESDHSAGTTLISYQDKPIWWMSYGDHYPEGAIPFLKSAMAKAYEQKLFLGGRGPTKVIAPKYKINDLNFYLVYKNDWSGDFQSFKGHEKIFQNPRIGYDPELIGHHQYFGMSLL